MNTGDIKVIQLANYVRPVVKEKPGEKWVLYGRHNEFFDYIIDRYKGSPTNESVINVYNQLLWGRGIALRDSKELYTPLFDIFDKREIRKVLCDFELFGQYAIEIIRARGGGIAKLNHIPFNKLGMGRKNEKNEIESVYYCDDWSKQHSNKPVEIPVYIGKLNEARMVKLVQPYIAGNDYFSDPDYLAGLQYAHLEEEISNYCINHIRNGLSFGYIINFNNGSALTPEQKDEIEAKIKEKLTGTSNAGKFILSFNDGVDTAVTVVPLDVNEAHSQWEFLSKESMSKILVSHGCTSPLLFGLPSAGGFGSNAEELDTASKLLQDYQIKPKQELFIDELASLLELNNLETDLVFIPLRDSYTADEVEEDVVDNTVDDDSQAVEMSSHEWHKDCIDEFLEMGEDEPEGYEIIDERACEEITLNETILNTIVELARQPRGGTPEDNPSGTSEQDTSIFKIRYKYAGNPLPERDFCQRVYNSGKVWKAENLNKELAVQPGMGPGGSATYNVFLFKGGVNCNHWWSRVIYLKENNEKISVNEARRILNSLEPGEERNEARWEQNDPRVAQAASPSNNHWKLT